MVTLSVCLETVFTDLPVDKRIEKIAEAGYGAVEFWHPEGTFDGNQVDFGRCPIITLHSNKSSRTSEESSEPHEHELKE